MSKCMRSGLHVALLLAIVSGCQSLSGEKKKNQSDKQPPAAPSKLVAIWSGSVQSDSGSKPVRGLGGRVYFYDQTHEPMQVDGTLVVYAYDETTGEKATEPTRKYLFSKEEVHNKLSVTEIGPSYSFWLPWDQLGGPKTQLSLIPVFTNSQGKVLIGEQARYLLPGKDSIELASGDSQGSVSLASHTDGRQDARQAGASKNERQGVIINKIHLPSSTQQRLIRPKPARHELESKSTVTHPDGSAWQQVSQSVIRAKGPVTNSGTTSAAAPSSRPADQAASTGPLATEAEPLQAGWLPGQPPVRASRFGQPIRSLELNAQGLSGQPRGLQP